MISESFRTPVGIAKIAAVATGIILVSLGSHSFSESYWFKLTVYFPDLGAVMKFYEICDYWLDSNPDKCPPISMEWYFVIAVIISLIYATCSFVITVQQRTRDNRPLVLADNILNLMMAVLVFAAGIVYIVDATQIHKLTKDEKYFIFDRKLRMLTGEKITAGVLACIQGLFHVIIPILVFRGAR